MSEAQATSPVAEDTSASGVAADTNAATEHEIDRNPDDYVEAEDENEAAVKARQRAEGEAGEGEGDGEAAEGAAAKTAASDADLVEVEAADGSKVKVPAALKDDFLRHADYTKKTQAHAAEVRAFQAEQQTQREQIAESREALPAEHAGVAIANHTVAQAQAEVAEFEKIDWATWRAQTMALPEDDPNKVSYKQLRSGYDAARETLADAQRMLGTAKEALTTKEQARLDEQAKGRETALATARQDTGKVLTSEGWDPQRFADVATFAVTELGYTPEELQDAVDPRPWRMADQLRASKAEIAKLTKALDQSKTAQTNLKAQESRPVETAKGNAQPTRPRDDNSTETWMDKRNREVAAKRAAQQKARAAR